MSKSLPGFLAVAAARSVAEESGGGYGLHREPEAPMPKLYPAPFNDADVADVAAFVETLK